MSDFKIGDVCELTDTVGGTESQGDYAQRGGGTRVVVFGVQPGCKPNIAELDDSFFAEKSKGWRATGVGSRCLKLVTPAPEASEPKPSFEDRMKALAKREQRQFAVKFAPDGTVFASASARDETLGVARAQAHYFATSAEEAVRQVMLRTSTGERIKKLEAELKALRESVEF